MFLLDDQQKFVIIYSILWILLGILFVVAIVLFVLRLVKIQKKGRLAVIEDDNTIQLELFNAFGAKENVVSVNVDMSRLTVEVQNIDLVDGEKLKTLGATGVLLVGNKVKCSFEDAQTIYTLLNK